MGEPAAKVPKMASSLDQLKDYTVIVADTGEFEGYFSIILYYRSMPVPVKSAVS